jgi:hypothetical protein
MKLDFINFLAFRFWIKQLILSSNEASVSHMITTRWLWVAYDACYITTLFWQQLWWASVRTAKWLEKRYRYKCSCSRWGFKLMIAWASWTIALKTVVPLVHEDSSLFRIYESSPTFKQVWLGSIRSCRISEYNPKTQIFLSLHNVETNKYSQPQGLNFNYQTFT